ncbi:unnamed protein product, partial [Allacma fusca]
IKVFKSPNNRTYKKYPKQASKTIATFKCQTTVESQNYFHSILQPTVETFKMRGFVILVIVSLLNLSVDDSLGKAICMCSPKLEGKPICGSDFKEYANHCMLQCGQYYDTHLTEVQRDSTGDCPMNGLEQ